MITYMTTKRFVEGLQVGDIIDPLLRDDYDYIVLINHKELRNLVIEIKGSHQHNIAVYDYSEFTRIKITSFIRDGKELIGLMSQMQGGEIFKKEYCDEELHDLERDVSECFDPDFNPIVKDIPVGEDGFTEGTYTVTIEWEATND